METKTNLVQDVALRLKAWLLGNAIVFIAPIVRKRNRRYTRLFFLEKGAPEMRNWHGEEKSRQHICHMEHLNITNAKTCRYH